MSPFKGFTIILWFTSEKFQIILDPSIPDIQIFQKLIWQSKVKVMGGVKGQGRISKETQYMMC